MTELALFVILFTISRVVFSAPEEDRLRFSDRREPEEPEYRRLSDRRPSGNDGSNINNAFKIPIAVIRGTSAAAQAFSPQNTQAIQKIFEIPVTTLDAVGNFIKESRPQRINNNNNNNNNFNNYNNDYNDDNDNNEETIESQRPLSLSDQRRQDRRKEIIKQREQERRRLMEQEKFFHNHGQQSNFGFFSSLMDLLLGGGGHHQGGNILGGHGHDHGHGHGHGRPPKRPLKPSKPFRPSGHGGHFGHGGLHGNVHGGNGGYQVHEQSDDVPNEYTGGSFSWLQTTGHSQYNDNTIQNKIAPGSEFHEQAEFRSQ